MIDDFIGAFDGSYIPAVVEEEDQKAFHNHKSFLSQNMFVVVLAFQFALTGWAKEFKLTL
jgi:hypothetical protein